MQFAVTQIYAVRMTQTITVRSRDFTGTAGKTWEAELLSQDDDLLVLRGIFDRRIVHSDLGVIDAGTISYEYYWLDRWYNVFRFHHPDGRFRNYYCNINMPPRLSNGALDYVDLDLDILVDADGSYRILDEIEFALNTVKHGYPAELIHEVANAVKELESLIEHREFPFDFRPDVL